MNKTIYNEPYRNLVKRLRAARIKRGLRQMDVARRVDKSRAWIGKVETFQVRLDLVHFVRLCRALGVGATGLIRRLEGELSEDSDGFPLRIRGWA